MPPKKSEAGPVRMCGARRCGSTNSNVPAGIPKVYKPAQCARACAEGSNLCTLCTKQETAFIGGKKGMWHGRYEQANIPAESHIKGAEWFAKQVAKVAATEAKAAGAAAVVVPDPAVKAAAKAAEQEAKAAAALQKRIATQAAAYEREQAAHVATMRRLVDQEIKAAAAAEKAAARAQTAAAASEARATRKAKTARRSSARRSSARRSSARRSSARRSSSARATIYMPATAAAAAKMGSNNTLGNMTLSSNTSSNLRWYAEHPEVTRPANMMPSALHGPRVTSSNRRSAPRFVSAASSGRRSTARRSSSSAATAPAAVRSSSSRPAAAAPVVQTNGAGNMAPAEQMLNLDALLAEMGGNANLY
jgi:hypothetical protein